MAAPWFIAVSLRNPDFPEFFFIHEHFARFLTTVHQRVEPWWFFLPLLLLGVLPWVPLARAGRGAWEGRAARAAGGGGGGGRWRCAASAAASQRAATHTVLPPFRPLSSC